MMDAGFTMINNDAIRQVVKIGPTAFVVYVALALHADERRECWPSIGRLSKITGLCERAIQNSIRKLKKCGWITVTTGGGTMANRYKLVSIPLFEPVNVDAPPDNQGMNVDASTPELNAPDPRTNMRNPGASTCTLTIPIEQDLLTRSTNKTHSSSPKLRFDEADMKTAQWMLALNKELDPGCNANLDRWANSIRIMRERDNRTDAEIRTLYQWAHNDSFWKSNILCPDKLREKWTQISVKQRTQKNGNRKSTIGPGQQYDPTHVSEGL